MKKFIFILVAVFATTFTSYAQLNVVNSGSTNKESYLAKDMYSNIKHDNNGYTLNVKDCQSNQHIIVLLGNNKDEYISSLNFLIEWVKTSPKKSYIVVQTNNGIVTFYKYMNNQLAVSYGGAEYIKKKISSLVMNSTIGTPQNKKYNDELMGYIQVKMLEKAINN